MPKIIGTIYYLNDTSRYHLIKLNDSMKNEINFSRRYFLSVAALTIAATEIGSFNLLSANEMPDMTTQTRKGNGIAISYFKEIKQIKAGLLDIGYAEAGPANGKPVILLHGWPYSIDSYAEVSALLSEKGYRVIVPHLRGHGSTRFLSESTKRNGQQSAIACDIIELMDALKIDSAVIAGYDWGARTANIIAALWPERCEALVSVSGYLIGSQEINKKPLSPKNEQSWWYQFYFATERGRMGYDANRKEFARLIWQTASPKWKFDDATFDRSAAVLDNADHVEIVIHNYRWRLGLADGEAHYDKYEETLAAGPSITVPTITIEGDENGAPHPAPENYKGKFKGKYIHLNLSGGIGHNPPQESPKLFADAVIQAAKMAL